MSPDIRTGLKGQGIESSGVSDDAILDAHFANVASGSSTRAAPARRSAPEPAARGRRARHHAGTPSGDGNGRAVRLSDAGYEALFGRDANSTDIRDGLEFSSGQKVPARRTADEIRAEARARDPESWNRAEAMRKQRYERGSEAEGDQAELYRYRFIRALEESESDQEAFSAAKAYAKVSPEGWRLFLEDWDEQVFQEADADGWTPDDPQYPSDPSMPSFVYGNAVRHALEQERAQAMLAHSQAMISGVTQSNVREYESRLVDAGLMPDADDSQSIEKYIALKNYIATSTGIDVGEMSVTDPDTAAAWMVKADAQLGTWDSQLRVHAFQDNLLKTETGSVAEGLTTSENETARLLREQNDLLRMQAGLGPVGEPEAPAFDPDWEPEPSQEEVADRPITVGAFREGLLESEGIKSESAWTKSGEPVSYSEATRDVEQEKAAEADRVSRAGII
jgi:hypothetical protein